MLLIIEVFYGLTGSTAPNRLLQASTGFYGLLRRSPTKYVVWIRMNRILV